MDFLRPAGLCLSLALGLAAAARHSPASAQDAAPSQQAALPAGPTLPGHSMHGDAFNEGPRQAAYLMEGMPQIDFPVTTRSPLAQQFFNQGVGQLHGFWYFEAERSFRQAAAIDPDCAMAYWGMAAANVNNEARAAKLIAEASARKAAVTVREARWIEALAEFYAAGPSNEKDRRRNYIRRLEAICQDFPDDVEAPAFLVVTLWNSMYHDLPIVSPQAVDALLSDVFDRNPNHPAHHYRIHLWDSEKPTRARASAALCGQSGPGIAHLWHMAGHTFSGLQQYADAAWQQEASARVDHEHMIRDRVLPYQIHNYAHNNEWLVRDLCFVGRAHDAVSLAKNLIELPRHPQHNSLATGGSAQLGRLRLFETLYEFELWAELLALADSSYLEAVPDHDDSVRRSRMVGAAAIAVGDVSRAGIAQQALADMLAKKKTEQADAGTAAEAQARNEQKTPEEIAAAKTNAEQAHAGAVAVLEQSLAELEGRRLVAQGRFADAAAQFEKAGPMSKSYLSQVHLAAGDAAKAEQLAREAVEERRNQVLPLANDVEILYRAGKQAEAVRAFEDLRTLACEADLDVPALARLAPLAEGLRIAGDWRIARVEWPAESGVRPPLDSLGPFRWHPSPAPPWSVVDGAGGLVGSETLRGRPVVLLFYLGFGCVHCVEQLKAFAPMTSQFADSGITLMAISTESAVQIEQSLAALPENERFPFPIVSNEDLSVFKAFRAYDDFESRPLHATILVDGENLVRWQDISYQPFSDPAFLLGEARRLLSQDLAGSTTGDPEAATAAR